MENANSQNLDTVYILLVSAHHLTAEQLVKLFTLLSTLCRLNTMMMLSAEIIPITWCECVVIPIIPPYLVRMSYPKTSGNFSGEKEMQQFCHYLPKPSFTILMVVLRVKLSCYSLSVKR